VTAQWPLVSIVTPVLNGASSIHLSLASVAAQTYPEIEHIVIDGGSTDGTVDIVQSFSEGRLTLVSEPDAGMYDAVNKGLGMAQGEVVAYLNSDDVYLPWSVETAVSSLRSGSDFVYGDLGMVRGSDQDSFMPQFYAPFDLNHFTYFQSLGQPSVFWRRAASQQLGGFDDSYRLIGDCDYWLRAAIAGYSFRHVREMLAIQFDHPGTLRKTHRLELRQEFERLRDHYRDAAGPATHRGMVEAALGWRLRMLAFYSSFYRRHPGDWSQFISWATAHQVKPDPRALRCLLPASTWPRAPSFTSAPRFIEALEGSLSVNAGEDRR
jgi:glycosyltransferase involved in cell wall biosynthesis